MGFKDSFRTGISFGLTSGIITTLGLMVGLNYGTHSKPAVLGGILTIAVADALSDALGIHMSEESEKRHTDSEIWQSSAYTFLAKFFFALTFAIPVLAFNLPKAIFISIIWGIFALSCLSYVTAKNEKKSPFKVIFSHLIIAVIVVIATYAIGVFVDININ